MTPQEAIAACDLPQGHKNVATVMLEAMLEAAEHEAKVSELELMRNDLSATLEADAAAEGSNDTQRRALAKEKIAASADISTLSSSIQRAKWDRAKAEAGAKTMTYTANMLSGCSAHTEARGGQ